LIARAEDPKLVSKTNGLLTQHEPFTSDQLEIMSSLVFLYENEHLEGEELIGTTKELKPRFPESQIRECIKIFKILGNFLPRYGQHIPA